MCVNVFVHFSFFVVSGSANFSAKWICGGRGVVEQSTQLPPTLFHGTLFLEFVGKSQEVKERCRKLKEDF